MNPVLTALVKLFEGGELEVQNGLEGYAYRGKIATVEFAPADERHGATLKATLEWNAKADGMRVGGGYVPVNGWDEDTELNYSCAMDLPSAEPGAPNIPNVTLQMVEDDLRMVIFNPYTGEMTVLFPKEGTKLNHDLVRWLPDGPKAQADARSKPTS